jgi:hypothetical protein
VNLVMDLRGFGGPLLLKNKKNRLKISNVLLISEVKVRSILLTVSCGFNLQMRNVCVQPLHLWTLRGPDNRR